MRDLQSKRWIVAKGALFLVLILATAGLLIAEAPTLRTTFLVATLAWSSARFYYFLFYVLERYVDPARRYAGLWHLLKARR